MAQKADDGPTWADLAPHVDEALAELPDELRTALVIHFLRGLTQQETAAELGIDQSTVSRRIEKGLDELRGKLRQAGVVASVAVLGTLLSENAATAAPATLLTSLGKMAMSGVGGSGTAAGAVSEASAGAAASAPAAVASTAIGTVGGKVAVAAAIGVLAVAGVVTYRQAAEPEAATAPSGPGATDDADQRDGSEATPVAGQPQWAATSEWAASEDGILSIRLCSPQKSYPRGEPFILVAELRNDSEKPVSVQRPFDDEHAARAHITGPKGRVKYVGWEIYRVAPPPRTAMLQPGKTVEGRIRLRLEDYDSLDVPGTYQVTCAYRFAEWRGEEEKRPAHWSGTIKTRAIELVRTQFRLLWRESSGIPIEKVPTPEGFKISPAKAVKPIMARLTRAPGWEFYLFVDAKNYYFGLTRNGTKLATPEPGHSAIDGTTGTTTYVEPNGAEKPVPSAPGATSKTSPVEKQCAVFRTAVSQIEGDRHSSEYSKSGSYQQAVREGQALVKMGKDVAPALTRMFEDKKAEFKLWAAWGLTKLGPEAERAVPALIKGLAHSNPEVCEAAAEALGNIGSGAKAAVPALINDLRQHFDGHGRWRSAWALGKIGPDAKTAVPALKEVLVRLEREGREDDKRIGILQRAIAEIEGK